MSKCSSVHLQYLHVRDPSGKGKLNVMQCRALGNDNGTVMGSAQFEYAAEVRFNCVWLVLFSFTE
jgi:hypothetical protein